MFELYMHMYDYAFIYYIFLLFMLFIISFMHLYDYACIYVYILIYIACCDKLATLSIFFGKDVGVEAVPEPIVIVRYR